MTIDGYDRELKIVEDMVKEGTVKVSWLDEEAQKKHAEEAYKLWDELASRDEASARAIQMLKKWRGVD